MEDVPQNSPFLRDRQTARNENTNGGSAFVQPRKIPETPQLLFGVCTRPLAELRRTAFTDLRVNVTAKGFYLFLRTLEPSVTDTVNSDFGPNAVVLVEDHLKNRTYCCLHGHVHLKSKTELNELLPVNTVFVLKEPFLVACAENQFAVVVGSPSDFVVVGRSHVLFDDAEALGWKEETEERIWLTLKWRKIGDDLFQKGKLYDASDAYLFALKNCSDNCTKLLLNIYLAKTFLAQNCYESAVRHALNVLKVEPLNEKALYCIGRAHYELGEYTKAKIYFEALKQASPTCKNVLAELVRCEQRLAEAEGKIDLYNLYRSSLTEITTPSDHGLFGRYFEFRQGPGNKRGAFATQNLEPGTLILVEKPVVTTFESPFSSENGVVSFMRKAFTVILKNPKTLGLKLHYLPGGCDLEGGKRRIFCDEVNELEPIVDACLLHKLIHRNFLKTKNNLVRDAPFAYQVFELASRFRHYCLSNCTFLVYKDVITVRTCTTVMEGEELFLRVYGNHLSFRDKQNSFDRSGFKCNCSLCVLDKMELTDVHDLRQALQTKFYAQMAVGAGDNLSAEGRLLPIVKELELTYNSRMPLRLFMFIVYRDLAKVVDRSSVGWKNKLEFYVEKGLNCVGLSTAFLLSCVEEFNPKIAILVLIPVVVFDYAALMAEKEYFSGRLHLARKWVKLLLLLERIFRGGNIEMLMGRFSDFKKVPSLLSTFAK